MPPTADTNLFAAPPPPPTTSSSRSLGQDTTRSAHYNALLNVEDEWDMPVLHISGNQQQQDKSAKPKESLSWQQELLRAGSNNASSAATTGRNGNNGSPVSRPRSRVQPAKDLRPAPMTSNNSAGRSRPALATLHSDSFPSSSSSLNWQQELLLRTDEVQLVQQVTATTTTTAVTSVTPARQRRNQIKDSITFGIATLDLAAAAETDVFSGAPASSNRRHKRATAVAPQVVENLVATPTKTAVEPRYAGPTFHNSPAPSALPMPSFMLRRQAVETVVATH